MEVEILEQLMQCVDVYKRQIEECILDRDIENKIVKVHIMKGLLD